MGDENKDYIWIQSILLWPKDDEFCFPTICINYLDNSHVFILFKSNIKVFFTNVTFSWQVKIFMINRNLTTHWTLIIFKILWSCWSSTSSFWLIWTRDRSLITFHIWKNVSVYFGDNLNTANLIKLKFNIEVVPSFISFLFNQAFVYYFLYVVKLWSEFEPLPLFRSILSMCWG